MGGVNLLEAVRQTIPGTRLLISLSARVHEGLCSGGVCRVSDSSAKPDNTLIIDENTLLSPSDPLSASQAALEMIAVQYSRTYNMNIVITRTLNLIGPRQNQQYVLSDIASQMARFISGYSDSKIFTGDITQSRDFLDVRDAVRLYYQIAKSGTSGIYTVSSGIPYKISDLIGILSDINGVSDFIYEEDPVRVVRYGSGVRYGSVDRIKAEFNFSPKYSIEKSLSDLMDYWIKRLDRQEF
jgi:nucleoside-diphosphate-sugar epimerase